MVKKAALVARVGMNSGHTSHIGGGASLAEKTTNTLAGLDAGRELIHDVSHATGSLRHASKPVGLSPIVSSSKAPSLLSSGGKFISKAGPIAWGAGMGMQAAAVAQNPNIAAENWQDMSNKNIVGRAYAGLSNAPATIAGAAQSAGNTLQATRELPAQQENLEAMQRKLISQQNSKAAPIQGPAAPIKPLSAAQEFPKAQYPSSPGL